MREELDPLEMKVECPMCTYIAYAHDLTDAGLLVEIKKITRLVLEDFGEAADDPISLADNALRRLPEGEMGPKADRRWKLQALRDEAMDRRSRP
jgi:hypothetical protein